MMDNVTLGGLNFKVEYPRDEDQGAPWDEEDGHGEVSPWVNRDKLPGELVLNSDRRGMKRYYDFAGACEIARRDGWGFLPGELKTRQYVDGWAAWVQLDYLGRKLAFECLDYPDKNSAIRAVYAKHSATMTPRQYAAGAAMADYERLRQWCNGQWEYIGIVVTHEESGLCESLWGIESDSGDYLDKVARELAESILDQITNDQAESIAESRPDLMPQYEESI